MQYLKHTSISLLMLTALSFSALGSHAHKAERKPNLSHQQAEWSKAQHADERKPNGQRHEMRMNLNA